MVLRVAVVTESFLPSVNGVTNSVVRVLESLKADGHEAIVIAPTSNSNEFLGFPVITTNRFYFQQFPVALPLLNMTSILRSFKPDVMHVAAPFALGRQAIRVAERLGIATVAVYQTDIAGYTKRYGLGVLRPIIDRLVGNIHRNATLNLAPTQEGVDYLQKLKAAEPNIWGRGVDLELFNPRRKETSEVQKFRKKVLMGKNLVVGFVGRLAAEKQVERFAELFDLPSVSFLIVGDGPERIRLEKLFSGQAVTFTGKLTGEDLANAYAAMDIFVHCGTEETFGQTIQEALATGLPVVAPDRGGPSYLVESSVTGYLVDPEKENSYRDRVLRLALDTDLRMAIGESARNSVHGKSWKVNNQKLFELYESAVRHKSNRVAA
ncbi:MAG: hypothetical protein RL319_539 [Actinomycetota bacterium]|jgi:phosphatidylinositol alpha 1,6-mannosyltransferase